MKNILIRETVRKRKTLYIIAIAAFLVAGLIFALAIDTNNMTSSNFGFMFCVMVFTITLLACSVGCVVDSFLNYGNDLYKGGGITTRMLPMSSAQKLWGRVGVELMQWAALLVMAIFTFALYFSKTDTVLEMENGIIDGLPSLIVLGIMLYAYIVLVVMAFVAAINIPKTWAPYSTLQLPVSMLLALILGVFGVELELTISYGVSALFAVMGVELGFIASAAKDVLLCLLMSGAVWIINVRMYERLPMAVFAKPIDRDRVA